METPTPGQERIGEARHKEKGEKPTYRMTPEILSERADALLKKIDSKDGQIDWKTLSDDMPKDGTETSDRSTAELIVKHGMALLERAARSGVQRRIDELKKILEPFAHPEEIEVVISTNKRPERPEQKKDAPRVKTETKTTKSAEANYNSTLADLRNKRDVFLATEEGKRSEAERKFIIDTAEELIRKGQEMRTRDGRGLMWDAGMILSSLEGFNYTNELLTRVQQSGGVEKAQPTPQSTRDLIDEKADGSPTGVLVGAKEPKKDLTGLNNEIDIFTARRRLRHGQHLLDRVAAATLTDTPEGKIDTNHSFYGSLRKTSNAVADSAEAAAIRNFQLATLEHVKAGFRTHDPKYIQEALEVGGHYAFADLELAKRTFREILSQSNKEDKKEDAVRTLIQNELSAIEASENGNEKLPKKDEEVKPTTDEAGAPAEDSKTKKESKIPKKPDPIKIVNTPSPQPRKIFSPFGAAKKIVSSIWNFFTETDEEAKGSAKQKIVIKTSLTETKPDKTPKTNKTEADKPGTPSKDPIYHDFDDLLEGTGWDTKRDTKASTKDQPKNEDDTKKPSDEVVGGETTKNTEPETRAEANKSSEILAVIESVLNLNTLNNAQKRMLRKGIFEDKKYADSKGARIDIEFLSHVLPIIELVPEGIETKITDYVAGIASKDSIKLIFDYLADNKKGKRKPELVTRLKERYAGMERSSAFQAMKSDVVFLKKIYTKLGGNPDELNLSDEQQNNKEEASVPEKDAKGVSAEKFFPKVGDLAFWEKNGKFVFSEPKAIERIEKNEATGEYFVFLDGGTVGIPLVEIFVANKYSPEITPADVKTEDGLQDLGKIFSEPAKEKPEEKPTDGATDKKIEDKTQEMDEPVPKPVKLPKKPGTKKGIAPATPAAEEESTNPDPKLILGNEKAQDTPQPEEEPVVVDNNQTILTPDDLEAQMNRGKRRGGKEGRGNKTGKGKAGGNGKQRRNRDNPYS